MTRPRRRINRRLRWLEALLVVGGVAGIGIWAWSRLHLEVSQHIANRTLDHQIESQSPKPPAVPSNGEVIGRLEIPRLKMRSIVREGAGQDTLEVALGHIPGTAFPGQPGNAGVAGHRDTLFRGLRNISKNDEIRFETGGATYRYEVESTSIVKPQDVKVLAPRPYPELTLVTCYPFYYVGSAPDRFIVKARLVPEPTAMAVPAVEPPQPVAPPKPARGTRPPDRVGFTLSNNHTRELAPGVLLGLTRTDPVRRRVSGWLWVRGEHRTIWLRDQASLHPVYFGRHQLMLTKVSSNSVRGYVK